jgi:hypothetical protein
MKNVAVNEIWMNPRGELYLIEWNACRCHPNDLIKTWGKRHGESAWYGRQSKTATTRRLRNQGHVRLDREVIALGE